MRIPIKMMTVSTIVAMALLSSSAYASPSKDNSGRTQESAERKEGKHRDFYKELNLTEEQKKLLEENKKQNREEMKALFTGMREKKALIQQEL